MFLNVCKQNFHILTCAYLKNKTCLYAKSSAYYFHMKTKILPDFRICISVPLKKEATTSVFHFKKAKIKRKHCEKDFLLHIDINSKCLNIGVNQ